MSQKTKRAYKYRFYPTLEQSTTLAQTFGCVRFVYNWGLSTRKTAYEEHGKSLYYKDLAALLPNLKKRYPWLAGVSSVPIQQALRHLDRAFVNFFEGRAEYPTFKKKQHDQSATYASVNGYVLNVARCTIVTPTPLNILAVGLTATACGGNVRPVRAKARQAVASEAGSSLP